MTAFIAYQPLGNAAPFGSRTSSKSPTGLHGRMPRIQSSSPSHQATAIINTDFVEVVDLTGSNQGVAREYLVAREVLEPTGLYPGDRAFPTTTDRNGTAVYSNLTYNDQTGDGEKGEKDNDETDCESEFSDLPSLEDIFAGIDKEFGVRDDLGCTASASPALVDGASKESGREIDGEDRADLSTTPATSVRLGATPNTPVLVDDDQSVDTHGAATTLDDGRLTTEAADLAILSGSSPTLSREFAKPGTDGGRDIPDNPAKYDADDRSSGGKEEGNKPYEDNVINTRTLARSETGDKSESNSSGIASNVLTSVGQIHDIFTEYEETIALSRRKQQTTRTTPHKCPDDNATAGSIPPFICQGEPRGDKDDAVVAADQAAVAEGGDTAPDHFSGKEIENGPPSQSRRENNRQKADTEDVESQYSMTLLGNCHSEGTSAATSHPFPTPRDADEATRSDPGSAIQGAADRKRARSSTQPRVVPDDGAPQKRPRRAIKETWKVREAREAKQACVGLEGKWHQRPSDSPRNTRSLSVGPDCAGGEVDYRVAHIEDVFLGEDDSIQCLVTWKSSLIAIENIAGGELRQRCEQLFRERYGHCELRRRPTNKRLTRKE